MIAMDGELNNRRKLLAALGAGTLAGSWACFAQPSARVWRVGFLSARSGAGSLESDMLGGAFLQGMRELGYIEGKNLLVESRWVAGKYDLLADSAAEFVRLKVDAILTSGTQSAKAAQRATATIPIVMANSNDPVGNGFVKNLAQPGGNITGLSNVLSDLTPKHLEMLLNMVPKLSNVAVLVNPTNTGHAAILKNVQSAAYTASVRMRPVEARTPQQIDTAFNRMNEEKVGAVIVVQDGLFIQQRSQIAALAAKRRLPAISALREYAEAGLLMTYGANIADSYRRAATYMDKIFKGAKPGNLPVEQPTKFELIINGKTARALGLAIPQSLQIMADKVIE